MVIIGDTRQRYSPPAMKRSSVKHIGSGLAHALEIVGEWWTLLVVWAIDNGCHRFEEIQKRLHIARNILSNRLSTLVHAGVVERRKYSDKPPRYEYHLTEVGLDLRSTLEVLDQWGNRWMRVSDTESAGMSRD